MLKIRLRATSFLILKLAKLRRKTSPVELAGAPEAIPAVLPPRSAARDEGRRGALRIPAERDEAQGRGAQAGPLRVAGPDVLRPRRRRDFS